MSCCGGNCGCGTGCKCGTSCTGCKMYPDLEYAGEMGTTKAVIIDGVAPTTPFFEGSSEMGVGAENDGCKCGPDCKCNPCTCK
ncbi:hypothetical protein Syun_002629 [Stephania yunnanensis]|uniref:Metallothionein-like protein n=1 Tax=Stephania yunnanensis TaxID=152371 RepID=A0AAP0LK17_9MAGN